MKLKINAKCSDMCYTSVPELGLEKDGYVPNGLGIGGGDYIELTIDIETGKIDGWKPLNEETLRASIPEEKERDPWS
jgi:hypothetical protein